MTKAEQKLNVVKPAGKISNIEKFFNYLFIKERKKRIEKKPMTIILPKHLKNKPKEQILEHLANKVGYHYQMAELWKQARQVVESNGDYVFEDDLEFEKK